jgi:rhodanese-related sulfurtransferase
MFNTIHPDQLAASNAREQFVMIDLRTAHEFQNDGIAGSIHIPYQELSDSIDKIATEKEVVLICNDGNMAGAARNFLMGYAKINNVSALQYGVAPLHQKLQKKKAG